MRNVRTLGLLGTGVIGGGWAARALHFGVNVVAADVKPEMEEWIRGAVANAEPALSRLTFAPLPPKGKLTFTTDLRVMAEQADYIQENIPEQLPLKQRMLAEVSRHAAPDVIIASSTSGLTPTDLQRDMRAPERFCVAHPFNPVYLLPLVELVGGEKTVQGTIDAAAKFLSYIGMHPLHVRREVPGHLTDRLQEALWREILHIVNDGIATTGELDESIIYGPGLRWAAMGTNLIYHLAGGESGMRHMLAQFGPCLKWPWTKLEAPELTETLIDRAAPVQYRRGRHLAFPRGAALPGCRDCVRLGRGRKDRAGKAATAARHRGAAGMGGLQPPYVRFPLRPGLRRCDGCAVSAGRRR
jgi:carnitine 3-dehydrogenase